MPAAVLSFVLLERAWGRSTNAVDQVSVSEKITASKQVARVLLGSGMLLQGRIPAELVGEISLAAVAKSGLVSSRKLRLLALMDDIEVGNRYALSCASKSLLLLHVQLQTKIAAYVVLAVAGGRIKRDLTTRLIARYYARVADVRPSDSKTLLYRLSGTGTVKTLTTRET